MKVEVHNKDVTKLMQKAINNVFVPGSFHMSSVFSPVGKQVVYIYVFDTKSACTFSTKSEIFFYQSKLSAICFSIFQGDLG